MQALTASWQLNHQKVGYHILENDPEVSAHIVDSIPYEALKSLTSKDGWNFLKPFLIKEFHKIILMKLAEHKIDKYRPHFLLPTAIERFESKTYQFGRVDYDYVLDILSHCSTNGKQKYSRTLQSFIEVYLPYKSILATSPIETRYRKTSSGRICCKRMPYFAMK